jgi:maltooligosyltrehalose trehalohydrolase
LPQDRFVACIHNHDQVGNRAIGDRLQEIVGFDRARIAAAVVAIIPFIPLIFQGEEWAASTPFQYFADHDDPEMARAVSMGRKKEFEAFGWDSSAIPDPEVRSTFENSKLDWDELSHGYHAEMLSWYRELIQLRKATLSLHERGPGHARVVFNEEDKWFSVERSDIALICNLGTAVKTLEAPVPGRILLASKAGVALIENTITLPPDTAVILR